jgi:hypothetical protein
VRLLQQSGERPSSYENDRGLRDVVIQHVGFIWFYAAGHALGFIIQHALFCSFGDSESNEPAEIGMGRIRYKEDNSYHCFINLILEI